MPSSHRPTKPGPGIYLTGAASELPGAEVRIPHSFEHLLDAFATFTAVRDEAGQIVDFRTVQASDSARAITGAIWRGEAGDGGVDNAAHSELFDDFCHVVETGEPLTTQFLEYEDSSHGGRRLVHAYEVRAARLGDGLAVGWRDVIGHVLAAAELERRNRELTLVGEMVEYLQTVESSDEVFDVAASFGSRLFEGFSGGLFLQNESGSVVEARASWGETTSGDQVFAPGGCWALRRGRRHGSFEGNTTPHCWHVAEDVEAQLCIPLIAQGQATGLLVLTKTGSASLSDTPPSSAASEALAVSVGEHLGLALTNMRLRGSLRDQSIRDPLTGLFNRRYLEETLEREISRSGRSGKPLSLMMLDIDRFKRFNDKFGHSGGDALLRELGAVLQTLIRLEDAACRYGGDEFVILLPESSLDVALLRADELLQAAHEFNIPHEGSVLSGVSLTIGVAAYPDHGTDVAELVRAADQAMFGAKHAGGDRVRVAETPDEQVPTTPLAPKPDPIG